MTTVKLTINGSDVERDVDPRTSLRDLLHDVLGLGDVKQGCAEGVCGACVVLIDGEPRASCLLLAVQADGRTITTASGIASLGGPIAEACDAFCAQAEAREAFQCGYCAPGFVVSASHLLAKRPAADASALRGALCGHICRCTGYQQIIESVTATAAGEPPPPSRARGDLADKLAGKTRYPTDLHFDDQLYAKVLWSHHASARVLSIDLAEARAVAGVEAVLTHNDIPGENLCADTLFAEDQPLLAVDRVRCRGDAVAVVVARSDAAAREALKAIRVEYEALPSVHDVVEAVASGATQVGGYHNVIAQFVRVHGNVDDALRDAEVVVEGTFASEINDHVCMEPESGVARWNGDVLELTVTTLTPHVVRLGVAKALALPLERVRVLTPRMGGSFGKYLVSGVELLLALAAFHVRRPVRLVLDRGEILARRAKRHPFWGRYRLGMKRDGTFTALDADVIADAGPYAGITPTLVSVFADEAAGAYAFPNLRARARGVVTNNLPTAPMRGFGSQQINFGIESLVEKAARTLGLDPVELRARNLTRVRADGRGGETEIESPPLAATLERVREAMGPRPVPPDGWRIGRGVAVVKCKYGFPYGMVDRFVVKVGLERGELYLESDVPDSGTGILASAARIASQELGLSKPLPVRMSVAIADDPSGVRFAEGSAPSALRSGLYRALERFQGIQAAASMALVIRTEPRVETHVLRTFARPINWLNGVVNKAKSSWFPYSIDSFIPRTSSSRGMFMVGNAAVDAARQLRRAVVAEAARQLGGSAEEFECSDRGVHRAGASLAWSDIASEKGLAGLGRATIPDGLLLDPRTGNQVGAVDHMYAAHGVDLAVHPHTGEVRVLRVVACQDVGKVFDPQVVRGQVLGAVTMGVAQCLSEKMFVERGAVQNANLHDYLVPTMLDVPRDIEVVLLESGTGIGPQGAKGVGEAGAVAAPIAVAHALYDALGVQVERIPTTPEDLARIRESHEQEGA